MFIHRIFLFTLILSSLHYPEFVTPCTTAQDCTNFSIANGSKYISCSNFKCICNYTLDCFESQSTSFCSLKPCRLYNAYKDICLVKSHNFVTILVLTVGAGFVGAANFYEGLFLPGSFQLVLFTLCLVLSCIICWLQYTTCCGGDHDLPKCLLYILFIVLIIIILLLSLSVGAWWLADILKLILGNKRDGEGCTIVPQF